MAGSLAQAETRMQLKAEEFNRKLEYVRKEMGRGGDQYVTMQSRRLVKKWAWLAPEKTGRLRAGFWAAASALGITSVYSRNNHPDIGEGQGILKLGGSNPSMLIANLVPYVGNAGGRGTGWWHVGLNSVMARMDTDLEKVVSGAWRYGEYRG